MDGNGRARIVLLGASNVQLGRRELIGAALGAAGGGADVYVAAGHGRSYGTWSWVYGRGLPGIVECGLWRALERSAGSGPGLAVLTDIGNDLAYGAAVEELASWVAACVERLRGQDFRITLNLFPEASVSRLSETRFWLLRSLLFPGRRFTLTAILRQGRELNAALRELAGRFDCVCTIPQASWFGVDPIHLRRAARGDAWRTMIEACSPGAAPAPLGEAVSLRGARAELRTLFGSERRTPQPCVALPTGGSGYFF